MASQSDYSLPYAIGNPNTTAPGELFPTNLGKERKRDANRQILLESAPPIAPPRSLSLPTALSPTQPVVQLTKCSGGQSHCRSVNKRLCQPVAQSAISPVAQYTSKTTRAVKTKRITFLALGNDNRYLGTAPHDMVERDALYNP